MSEREWFPRCHITYPLLRCFTSQDHSEDIWFLVLRLVTFSMLGQIAQSRATDSARKAFFIAEFV